jgi:hypothetical protein
MDQTHFLAGPLVTWVEKSRSCTKITCSGTKKTESTSALSRKHYVPIKWVSDIRGAITVGVMVEYLQL